MAKKNAKKSKKKSGRRRARGSAGGQAEPLFGGIVEEQDFRGCPDGWIELIQEAERRGYVEFHGNRIKYNCANARQEDFMDPEERVRAGIYAWLIIEMEYPAPHIKVEVQVPRRTPSDFADIVVYSDDTCSTPYLVVEAKAVSCTAAEFRQAIEQGFGNSNSLRDTALCLIDSGRRSQAYRVAGFPHNERRENLLGDRQHVPRGYANVAEFRIIAGSPDDITAPTEGQLESAVRRAHALIWAGGRRDPLSAFDEWCKLLFAKIHDERRTANDDPRRFQVGRNESEVATANRIRALYASAQREDASIFTAPIALPDDKIVQVVRMLEQMAFTQTDVDTLGGAFETFFGQIFRGELGQYFTRRELVRFVCAMLEPTDRDKILDPTAGSGGFLLETLIQVWHYIDDRYAGQPDQERRKFDFARNNLFGIEIQDVLGRICQTNLMIHKDGHTNVETSRSCLDSTFQNPGLNPDPPTFTLVVGNPPFGDEVIEGSRDHLGANQLRNFELANSNSISSELVITERAIKWLVPGEGRIGFVVPDGMLNNPGESSRCPAFRRWLFRHCRVLSIVSLADHAFRKSGAQNKTSLLFARRLSDDEKQAMDDAIQEYRDQNLDEEDEFTPAVENDALAYALQAYDYDVFLAEADHLGYTPAGAPTDQNDLYRKNGMHVDAPENTILGQYQAFSRNPAVYDGCTRPACRSLAASEMYQAHRTHRVDPKYHIFKAVEEIEAPEGLTAYRLGNILVRRADEVVPNDNPDQLFKTITLTQEGQLEPREAGKGINPPEWFGAYFKENQTWYVVHDGDILLSRIDLWKGCIGVVTPEFDGGIVTGEFPAYKLNDDYGDHVDLRYIQLLLRTAYFQRAIRAITTGHSNRRRTQEDDFLALRVFLPDKAVQTQIVEAIDDVHRRLTITRAELVTKLSVLDQITLAAITPETLADVFPVQPPG